MIKINIKFIKTIIKTPLWSTINGWSEHIDKINGAEKRQ